MAQRDYILRMIEEMGAVLIALRNAILRGGAPPGEVEHTLRRATSAAGMELELARVVAVEALTDMVAPGGEVEPARCWVLAEALMTDGADLMQRGEGEMARSSLSRAAVLFELVAPWGAYLTGFPEARERIEEIEGMLEAIGGPAGGDDLGTTAEGPGRFS